MKFGCAIGTCIFLNSENLICRSTDISKYFRRSLQLRDNESRLYLRSGISLLFSFLSSMFYSLSLSLRDGEMMWSGGRGGAGAGRRVGGRSGKVSLIKCGETISLDPQ